jgi:hypothetical protein
MRLYKQVFYNFNFIFIFSLIYIIWHIVSYENSS